MDFDNFKELIHESWWAKLSPWIESEDCDKLYAFLKRESKRGRVLCPLSSNVWKAFLLTPYEEVRVILCGFSPYHSLYNKKPVASGLLMDCSITGRLQPSLEKWYDEIDRVYEVKCKRNPDLSYLAKDGVLMLNAGLTTEALKAGSHNLRWEGFMKYLFEEVLITTGMPVIFLGKEARKVEKYIAPFTWVFKPLHPVSASYTSSDWDSEGIFLQTNEILKGNNNSTVTWYQT
jgi:uracil-DNA glycosylase